MAMHKGGRSKKDRDMYGAKRYTYKEMGRGYGYGEMIERDR